MNKITDMKGRTITIKDEECYTVIYSIRGINNLIVLTNLRHQCKDDTFIGQVNNYGFITEDKKIYFDDFDPTIGKPVFDNNPTKQIHRVFTNKEWQSILTLALGMNW